MSMLMELGFQGLCVLQGRSGRLEVSLSALAQAD